MKSISVKRVKMLSMEAAVASLLFKWAELAILSLKTTWPHSFNNTVLTVFPSI